jgi:hypothetical protein
LLVKSIRIELGISNISPNFGETSQKLICIKLSIVSPEYLLSESFTIFDAHAIPFIIIIFFHSRAFLHFPPSFSFSKSLFVTFLRIKVGITWAACCLSLPPYHDLLPHQHHRRHTLILPQDPPSTAPPWLTIRYSPTLTYSVSIVWLLRKKRRKIRVVVGSSFQVANVGSKFFF